MNPKYEKFNYDRYLNRLNKLDNPLIKRRCIGHTTYNYPLYDFVVGDGKKDLFLVGGTHGSEIIGVDYLTQLLTMALPTCQYATPETNKHPNLSSALP